MKTIDGLYFYEFILLVLGILLFITILVILIVFVIQKRSLKELFIFFFLSIIMIGYPSIQKIVYDNGIVTIEKYATAIAKDPSNSDQRSKLEMTLKKIERRQTMNYKTLIEFGKAQAILGDTVRAEKLVDRALRISPDFSEARMLQTKFNTPQVQIEKLIAEIKENPGNTSLKTELETKISSFAMAPDSNASVLTTAATAHASLGDTAKVLLFANSALNKDINNTEAAALKKRFSKETVHK